MESRTYTVSLEKNPTISIKVTPGHFTTSFSHVSHYLDMSTLKSNAMVAREVARELAIPYLSTTMIDTIVCMERTEVIGAYLAEELLAEGPSIINTGGEIHVVTPIIHHHGNLFFPGNVIEWLTDKNVLLLVSSISSGRTIHAAVDCIKYYNGNLSGISALFLASHEEQGKEVHALFTSEDIEEYTASGIDECEMCKSGRALTAIISSDGYTRM